MALKSLRYRFRVPRNTHAGGAHFPCPLAQFPLPPMTAVGAVASKAIATNYLLLERTASGPRQGSVDRSS